MQGQFGAFGTAKAWGTNPTSSSDVLSFIGQVAEPVSDVVDIFADPYARKARLEKTIAARRSRGQDTSVQEAKLASVTREIEQLEAQTKDVRDWRADVSENLDMTKILLGAGTFALGAIGLAALIRSFK